MGLPWYLKPDWMLHEDMMTEQALSDANSRARDRDQDKEIERLKRRVSELETQLLALEKYLSEKGILPPMPEEPETSMPGDKSRGKPVTFPARTEENITCPHCGRKQKGNRNACYSCGTPFQYENE